MEKRSSQILLRSILLIIGLTSAFLALTIFKPFGLEPWIALNWTENHLYLPLAKLYKNVLLSPAFYIAIGLTLTMERLMPADPKQKMFGTSFVQDLAWFFYETILHAFIISTYVYWIKEIYIHNFKFLTIETAALWPEWTRFICGVLLLDLLYWLQHYFNHKVEWFWSFHTVHHSQKELNFFTDYRYHFVEYIVRQTVLVIPFLLFDIDVPAIVAFSIFRRWYTRFYHGNIRLNLGPLRYILVTPQSHRIHHSVLPQHRDKNFGSLFSIWDFMFGTQYLGFDEYPETGITDNAFPLERSTKLSQVLWTPLVQLAYPFKIIGRDIRRRLAKLQGK